MPGHPPWDGAVALQHDDAANRWVLHHRWTGEALSLDGGPWSIGFDEDGSGLLVDDLGEPCWVQDRLRVKLRYSGRGALLVTEPGGVEQLLFDRAAQRVQKQVFIKPVASEGFLLEVADFRHRVQGAFVWWSLPCLYKCLGLPGQPHQFYHKQWGRWQDWCESLSLTTPHLRRAVVTHYYKGVPTEEAGHEQLWRCLGFYSWSSHALVALLARLGSEKWRQRVEERRLAFSAALTAVLKRALTDPKCTIRLFMPSDTCIPGLPATGEGPSVEVTISEMLIDLSPLLGCENRLGAKWCQCLRLAACGPRVGLAQFVQAAHDAGEDCKDLFKQLVMFFGTLLDEGVHNRCSDAVAAFGEDAGNLGAQVGMSKVRLRKRLVDIVRLRSLNHEAERRMQYFIACRGLFGGRKNFALAIDATRMGKKNIVAGVLTTSDGYCAICPPQARPSQMGTNWAHINGYVRLVRNMKNLPACSGACCAHEVGRSAQHGFTKCGSVFTKCGCGPVTY
jgi:hypothetical protein